MSTVLTRGKLVVNEPNAPIEKLSPGKLLKERISSIGIKLKALTLSLNLKAVLEILVMAVSSLFILWVLVSVLNVSMCNASPDTLQYIHDLNFFKVLVQLV